MHTVHGVKRFRNWKIIGPIAVALFLSLGFTYVRFVEPARLHGLALSASDHQDYQRAERLWARAVAMAPHNSKYRYNLGVVLARLHAYDAATVHLTRAVELDPENRQYARALTLVGRHLRDDN